MSCNCGISCSHGNHAIAGVTSGITVMGPICGPWKHVCAFTPVLPVVLCLVTYCM